MAILGGGIMKEEILIQKISNEWCLLNGEKGGIPIKFARKEAVFEFLKVIGYEAVIDAPDFIRAKRKEEK